ncbi:MAG: hypothetical protein PGN25_02945 [Methylorubrum populi]
MRIVLVANAASGRFADGLTPAAIRERRGARHPALRHHEPARGRRQRLRGGFGKGSGADPGRWRRVDALHRPPAAPWRLARLALGFGLGRWRDLPGLERRFAVSARRRALRVMNDGEIRLIAPPLRCRPIPTGDDPASSPVARAKVRRRASAGRKGYDHRSASMPLGMMPRALAVIVPEAVR